MNNNDIKLLKEYFDTLVEIPEGLENTVAKLNATYNIITNQETLSNLQLQENSPTSGTNGK